MVHEEPVERLGQVGRPIAGGQGGVLPLQEGRLVLHGLEDALVVLDVLCHSVWRLNLAGFYFLWHPGSLSVVSSDGYETSHANEGPAKSRLMKRALCR